MKLGRRGAQGDNVIDLVDDMNWADLKLRRLGLMKTDCDDNSLGGAPGGSISTENCPTTVPWVDPHGGRPGLSY